MTLADVFEAQLAELAAPESPDMEMINRARRNLEVTGKMLCQQYRTNLETLASIAADYVKTYHELQDIKARARDDSTVARLMGVAQIG